ncbi:MAG: hypothetical protein H6740_27595 [Alphaproteobacteria bacterium]|nr:hypothetical protein [Alphaproteobacteria bacterium]
MRSLPLALLSLIACRNDEGVKDVTLDLDGDGFAADVDCDDEDAEIGAGVAFFRDADGDGYGDPGDTTTACEAPEGYADNATDCDDGDANIHPDAPEDDCADPVDYNCDGSVGYADADGDGYPACEDCNDGAAAIHPDAEELCDEVDNDCDGTTDLNAVDAPTWYGDSDGDGFGGDRFTEAACEAPEGYVDNADDCDDLDPESFPGGEESCDETDNDCDSQIDEGVLETYYQDADRDGYGDLDATIEACEVPTGYSADADDCDDADRAVNPSAAEVCDGLDNDCDGEVDGASAVDASSWYADGDGDGYGDASSGQDACTQPSGHVDNADDCDDADGAVYPGATELCDGVDNNCDGSVDESSAADAATWYADADGDGFGDLGSDQDACAQPSGYVSDSSDCDDGDGAVNSAATELCDGVDNNCDGSVDEASAADAATWYADDDGDSYGDLSDSQAACSQPNGYVSDGSDCDDLDAAIYPGAEDTCDGEDNDCDGSVDNDATALGEAEECAAVDCADILSANSSAADGSYWVTSGSGDTIEVYCDFSNGYTWLSSGGPPDYYWSFDSSASSSDVGGVTGTARGSTALSSTIPASGFGSSVSFDNNDTTRVDLSNGPTLSGTANTIAVWTRHTSCSNNQIPLMFNSSGWLMDRLYDYRVYFNSIQFISSSNNCSSTVNTWQHNVYIDTGNSWEVYLDGVQQSFSYSYGSIAGEQLTSLGSRSGFGTNGMAGQLDDLAIWHRALSSAEVEQIYDEAVTNGTPLTGP